MEQDLLARAVSPGAQAPHFALTADTGDTVRLRDLLVHGPAVLVFYRGSFW